MLSEGHDPLAPPPRGWRGFSHQAREAWTALDGRGIVGWTGRDMTLPALRPASRTLSPPRQEDGGEFGPRPPREKRNNGRREQDERVHRPLEGGDGVIAMGRVLKVGPTAYDAPPPSLLSGRCGSPDGTAACAPPRSRRQAARSSRTRAEGEGRGESALFRRGERREAAMGRSRGGVAWNGPRRGSDGADGKSAARRLRDAALAESDFLDGGEDSLNRGLKRQSTVRAVTKDRDAASGKRSAQ
ncbi:hypothetical protein THAOC_04127 [Thalassiosira oceanica]|uniref:Uncharacterized protein n=1 Tax=Thalassiosira oceanica TaxID=159749 RepID=K0TAV7_THAOC|nr:hypothetical protein THAOC_04127 [Thalassiosira oceanica]|eukprot:EJK74209.1 hypothetical protein THAOC_04127 [Thalassiosira oceanica]